MLKKIIPFAVGIIVLGACNNSSGDKEAAKDSSMMDHSDMHQMDAGDATVPEIPAVPDGAKIFFKNLKNGAQVTSPFKVEMGVEGIKVDTAGPVLAGVGHHHLLIDAGDSIATGQMIPKDSAHVHFGKGQTETEVSLSPGRHHLTLQFADGLHRSYGSRMATSVNVTVKK
ncbi:MAG TPA: DUF4399 domain-containing protein [Chitinophagaceae bacterium]|nr:DUF4399 domain-containing protein [Chitinophagaceae bacterium]